MGLFDSLGRAAAAALGELSKASPAAPDAGAEKIPDGLPAKEDPKSLFFDPYSILDQMGYKEKPTTMSYDTLRAVMFRMPILPIIIKTRIDQIASFSKPQDNRFELGFRIRLRNHRGKPSHQDRRVMAQIQRMIVNTGVTENPRGRDNFETYLRKVVWDSLVFDQMCTEIVPNRKGTPAEFYAVDAATIRLADTTSLTLDEDDQKRVRYVQIYDGSVINEYTQQEMCFGVRNPRTDLRSYGYGTSEIEMVMAGITSLIYSWDYNSRAFAQGSSAKGILNFKGAVPEKMLSAFKRQWYSMLTGIENAWRTPITNAEDLQWISMQQSNRDMEFNAWMDFLIKVVSSVFSMDPSEINFKYGNTGQSSAMSEESNRDKLSDSRERGLKPLLTHLETNLNDYVIQPGFPEFELEFVGLDATTRDASADLATKRVKAYQTIDEIRAEDDLPPLPDGKGAIILDPTFVQFSSGRDQALQAQQQQQQDGGGSADDGTGDGGADGGQEGGGDGQSGDDEDAEAAPEDDAESDQDDGEPTQKSLGAGRPFNLDLHF